MLLFVWKEERKGGRKETGVSKRGKEGRKGLNINVCVHRIPWMVHRRLVM